MQMINVRAQKINDSVLKTFEMVIADFQIEDKVSRPRFFQEIFLVANTKFEVVLEMLFLKSAMQTWHLVKEYLRGSPILPTKSYQPSNGSN